jgi:hypothetical protein
VKYLTILLFILVPSLAYSEGYLTVKQPVARSVMGSNYSYYPYQNNYSPDVSIFFTEPLGGQWSIMSWNGFVTGNTFVFDENLVYAVSPKLRLGVGVNYSDGRLEDSFGDSVRYRNIEGKVWGELKLW